MNQQVSGKDLGRIITFHEIYFLLAMNSHLDDGHLKVVILSKINRFEIFRFDLKHF